MGTQLLHLACQGGAIRPSASRQLRHCQYAPTHWIVYKWGIKIVRFACVCCAGLFLVRKAVSKTTSSKICSAQFILYCNGKRNFIFATTNVPVVFCKERDSLEISATQQTWHATCDTVDVACHLRHRIKLTVNALMALGRNRYRREVAQQQILQVVPLLLAERGHCVGDAAQARHRDVVDHSDALGDLATGKGGSSSVVTSL